METRNLPELDQNACKFCYQVHEKGNCTNPNNPEALFIVAKKNATTQEAPALTWERMTGWQKFWTVTGQVFAFIMAVGCGISTAAAFLTLELMAAGMASFIIAGLIFVAGTVINYYIFKGAVPEVLIDLFGKDGWFQGLFELKGGCDLVHTDKDPTTTPLNDLPIDSHAAYLRFGNKLYYINKLSKDEPVLELTDVSGEKLTDFDAGMNVGTLTLNQPKKLSANGLAKVTALSGHSQVSNWKKLVMALGVTLALSVGITFGALTYTSTFSLTAAFGFLAAISPAFPPIAAVLAAVTFVCLTALMLKDIAALIKTENVWQACKDFVGNMFDVSPRCELRSMNSAPTPTKLPTLGLTTNAAYIKVQDQVYYVNQETGECSLQDVKASALYSDAAWTANEGAPLSHETLKAITDKTGQTPKGLGWTIFDRILTTLLTIGFIPLAMLGLFMTQNACASGVKAFLFSYIPNASAAAVNVCSNIISLGLAFLGQIPFVLSTTVSTISSFCSKEIDKAVKKHDALAKEYKDAPFFSAANVNYAIKVGALYTLALVNAVGNGLISAVGGAMSLTIQMLSGVGGFWNSFAAGAAAIQSSLSGKPEKMLELYQQQESSRTWRMLGMIVGAILFTPLSLLVTLPIWKKAENQDDRIERLEIPTQVYEQIRQKRKELKASSTAAILAHANTAEEKPVENTDKPHKYVVDSADFQTKIIYADKAAADRLRFYARTEKTELNAYDMHELNELKKESVHLASPAA